MYALSGPPMRKAAKRIASGTMQASEIRPTVPMGRSRSAIATLSLPPRARVRDDAIDARSPVTTGFASLTTVQIAAMPIVPAPMKRT